jgi:hypothetical protein
MASNQIDINPITLIIQGHGTEDTDIGLIANNVQLLSISGAPGENGLMSMCLDKNGNERSLDLIVMDKLKETYIDAIDHGVTSQHIIFNDILPEVLEREYTNCNVVFNKNGGFKLTKPISERTFIFQPNRHENCRVCIEDGSCKRCLKERDMSKILSPEYGLTIITTNNPYDISLYNSKRQDANLHMNPRARLYWRNKLLRGSISMTNFDKMFNENTIDLSELLTIFRDMGYVDIFIIDPTCRYCTSNPSRGRRNLFSIMEQLLYQNVTTKREVGQLINTTSEIITFKRKYRENRNSRRNQLIPRSSDFIFTNISSGMIIGLSALILLISYIITKKGGSIKKHNNKYNNKKSIFSYLLKKGAKSKHTTRKRRN